MKIVCASSVFMGEEAFSTLGETTIRADDAIDAETVRDADLLVVRSGTRVTPGLLEGSRVAFVGTTIAGTDHVDIDYLESTERGWCAAPGCNANSVAEYVVAAMLYLAEQHGRVLNDLVLGVIGVGHVGRRVVAFANALGLTVLKNDPPLQELTGSNEFVSLPDLLAASDIVTLHVPLITARLYPTVHLVNHRFFETLQPGAFFLNTSRGLVVDTDALLYSLDRGIVTGAALDVWAGEPDYSATLLQSVDLATPHIAGHSMEGRLNGTVAVYQEAARFFELNATWKPVPLPPGRGPQELHVDARGRSDEEALNELVRRVYDITEDDRALRQCTSKNAAERKAHFLKCRQAYPPRREFSSVSAFIPSSHRALREKAAGLGFQVSHA